MRPSAIVSSDLVRASTTAEYLGKLTGRPVHVDPRLREAQSGEWQGLTTPEIRAQHAGDFDAWLRGEDVAAGGGERRIEVGRRVALAVSDAVAELPAGATTLVVVTHGGSARAAIGMLLGLSPQLWTRLGLLSNCSWSVLEEQPDSWRLLEHNAGSLPEPVLGNEG